MPSSFLQVQESSTSNNIQLTDITHVIGAIDNLWLFWNAQNIKILTMALDLSFISPVQASWLLLGNNSKSCDWNSQSWTWLISLAVLMSIAAFELLYWFRCVASRSICRNSKIDVSMVVQIYSPIRGANARCSTTWSHSWNYSKETCQEPACSEFETWSQNFAKSSACETLSAYFQFASPFIEVPCHVQDLLITLTGIIVFAYQLLSLCSDSLTLSAFRVFQRNKCWFICWAR